MQNNLIKIVTIVISIISLQSSIFSQGDDEYTLKAIWLGKFTHFIDWPDPSVKDVDEFCIGILNNDPFKGKLETIYMNKTVWKKPVRIEHINNLDSLQNVNLLFIPSTCTKDLNTIITEARKHSILLISDTKGYAEKGSHINFLLKEKRIRFEINESAIRDSGFNVSYRLLNIAKIVQPISISSE